MRSCTPPPSCGGGTTPTAEPRTSGGYIGVRFIECMSALTVCFPRIDAHHGAALANVFPVRHRAQVGRIHACANIADVVNFHAARHRPLEEFVRSAVSVAATTPIPNLAVAGRQSGTIPEPAPAVGLHGVFFFKSQKKSRIHHAALALTHTALFRYRRLRVLAVAWSKETHSASARRRRGIWWYPSVRQNKEEDHHGCLQTAPNGLHSKTR